MAVGVGVGAGAGAGARLGEADQRGEDVGQDDGGVRGGPEEEDGEPGGDVDLADGGDAAEEAAAGGIGRRGDDEVRPGGRERGDGEEGEEVGESVTDEGGQGEEGGRRASEEADDGEVAEAAEQGAPVVAAVAEEAVERPEGARDGLAGLGGGKSDGIGGVLGDAVVVDGEGLVCREGVLDGGEGRIDLAEGVRELGKGGRLLAGGFRPGVEGATHDYKNREEDDKVGDIKEEAERREDRLLWRVLDEALGQASHGDAGNHGHRGSFCVFMYVYVLSTVKSDARERMLMKITKESDERDGPDRQGGRLGLCTTTRDSGGVSFGPEGSWRLPDTNPTQTAPPQRGLACPCLWVWVGGLWVGVPKIPECEQGVGCHKHTVYIVHSRRRTSR